MSKKSEKEEAVPSANSCFHGVRLETGTATADKATSYNLFRTVLDAQKHCRRRSFFVFFLQNQTRNKFFQRDKIDDSNEATLMWITCSIFLLVYRAVVVELCTNAKGNHVSTPPPPPSSVQFLRSMLRNCIIPTCSNTIFFASVSKLQCKASEGKKRKDTLEVVSTIIKNNSTPTEMNHNR